MQVDNELWQEVAADEGALDERLKEAISGVEAERERMAEARKQAAQAVAVLDQRIKRANRIVRAAGFLHEAAQPRTKRPKRTSTATLEAVRNAVLKHASKGVTARELAEETGLNKTTVREALGNLRQEQAVRLAGKRKGESSMGQPASVYKPMENGKVVSEGDGDR